jgi:hypothetical protein
VKSAITVFRAKLIGRRYAWFGALRNPEHLHAVHPFNRLMDEKGEVTPLYVPTSRFW